METNYKDQYRKLGLNIDYYRKEKGFSQMQLADKIDISRTHMSRIENSDSSVSLDVIFRIADTLSIPVYKLYAIRE